MSKFAIGDKVDQASEARGGVVVAVFATDDGNFRYAVDMEGYGALQFLTEEKLVGHISQSATTDRESGSDQKRAYRQTA